MTEPQVTMVSCERCGKPVRGRDVVEEVVRFPVGDYVYRSVYFYVCPECAEKE